MQLEFTNPFFCQNGSLIFQSHIGAIRIACRHARALEDYTFQSHIGAIRISDSGTASGLGNDFNPTLVQLEFGGGRGKVANVVNFNPTLVQLESTLAQDDEFLIPEISIPHWCN